MSLGTAALRVRGQRPRKRIAFVCAVVLAASGAGACQSKCGQVCDRYRECLAGDRSLPEPLRALLVGESCEVMCETALKAEHPSAQANLDRVLRNSCDQIKAELGVGVAPPRDEPGADRGRPGDERPAPDEDRPRPPAERGPASRSAPDLAGTGPATSPAAVDGSLALRSYVRDGIFGRMHEIQRCYEEVYVRNAGKEGNDCLRAVNGWMVLDLCIAPGGSVTRAGIEEARPASCPELERCVLKEVRRCRFAPREGKEEIGATFPLHVDVRGF